MFTAPRVFNLLVLEEGEEYLTDCLSSVQSTHPYVLPAAVLAEGEELLDPGSIVPSTSSPTASTSSSLSNSSSASTASRHAVPTGFVSAAGVTSSGAAASRHRQSPPPPSLQQQQQQQNLNSSSSSLGSRSRGFFSFSSFGSSDTSSSSAGPEVSAPSSSLPSPAAASPSTAYTGAASVGARAVAHPTALSGAAACSPLSFPSSYYRPPGNTLLPTAARVESFYSPLLYKQPPSLALQVLVQQQQQQKAERGRLRVCSKSLIFDSHQQAADILKIPFRKILFLQPLVSVASPPPAALHHHQEQQQKNTHTRLSQYGQLSSGKNSNGSGITEGGSSNNTRSTIRDSVPGHGGSNGRLNPFSPSNSISSSNSRQQEGILHGRCIGWSADSRNSSSNSRGESSSDSSSGCWLLLAATEITRVPTLQCHGKTRCVRPFTTEAASAAEPYSGELLEAAAVAAAHDSTAAATGFAVGLPIPPPIKEELMTAASRALPQDAPECVRAFVVNKQQHSRGKGETATTGAPPAAAASSTNSSRGNVNSHNSSNDHDSTSSSTTTKDSELIEELHTSNTGNRKGRISKFSAAAGAADWWWSSSYAATAAAAGTSTLFFSSSSTSYSCSADAGVNAPAQQTNNNPIQQQQQQHVFLFLVYIEGTGVTGGGVSVSSSPAGCDPFHNAATAAAPGRNSKQQHLSQLLALIDGLWRACHNKPLVPRIHHWPIVPAVNTNISSQAVSGTLNISSSSSFSSSFPPSPPTSSFSSSSSSPIRQTAKQQQQSQAAAAAEDTSTTHKCTEEQMLLLVDAEDYARQQLLHLTQHLTFNWSELGHREHLLLPSSKALQLIFINVNATAAAAGDAAAHNSSNSFRDGPRCEEEREATTAAEARQRDDDVTGYNRNEERAAGVTATGAAIAAGAGPISAGKATSARTAGSTGGGGGGRGGGNKDGREEEKALNATEAEARNRKKRPFKLLLLEFEDEDEREIVARALQKQKPEAFLVESSPAYVYRMQQLWIEGKLSTYHYLDFLNCIAGRSKSDYSAYPVFPWTLMRFDATDRLPPPQDTATMRDLSKPVGALEPQRLQALQQRMQEIQVDPHTVASGSGARRSSKGRIASQWPNRMGSSGGAAAISSSSSGLPYSSVPSSPSSASTLRYTDQVVGSSCIGRGGRRGESGTRLDHHTRCRTESASEGEHFLPMEEEDGEEGEEDRDNRRDISYLYGSHYSTPAFTVHWLVRCVPECQLRLHGGRFDAPQRMFNSMQSACRGALTGQSTFVELIPEFYEYDASFLLNKLSIYLSPLPSFLPLFPSSTGAAAVMTRMQHQQQQPALPLADVELPPWPPVDPCSSNSNRSNSSSRQGSVIRPNGQLLSDAFPAATAATGEDQARRTTVTAIAGGTGGETPTPVVENHTAAAASFLLRLRQVLEGPWVSQNIHKWIDLIFGYKQTGEAARLACNVFHPLTYANAAAAAATGSCCPLNTQRKYLPPAAAALLQQLHPHALQVQLQEFGQAPIQLFDAPHPIRLACPSFDASAWRAACSSGDSSPLWGNSNSSSNMNSSSAVRGSSNSFLRCSSMWGDMPWFVYIFYNRHLLLATGSASSLTASAALLSNGSCISSSNGSYHYRPTPTQKGLQAATASTAGAGAPAAAPSTISYNVTASSSIQQQQSQEKHQQQPYEPVRASSAASSAYAPIVREGAVPSSSTPLLSQQQQQQQSQNRQSGPQQALHHAATLIPLQRAYDRGGGIEEEGAAKAGEHSRGTSVVPTTSSKNTRISRTAQAPAPYASPWSCLVDRLLLLRRRQKQHQQELLQQQEQMKQGQQHPKDKQQQQHFMELRRRQRMQEKLLQTSQIHCLMRGWSATSGCSTITSLHLWGGFLCCTANNGSVCCLLLQEAFIRARSRKKREVAGIAHSRQPPLSVTFAAGESSQQEHILNSSSGTAATAEGRKVQSRGEGGNNTDGSTAKNNNRSSRETSPFACDKGNVPDKPTEQQYGQQQHLVQQRQQSELCDCEKRDVRDEESEETCTGQTGAARSRKEEAAKKNNRFPLSFPIIELKDMHSLTVYRLSSTPLCSAAFIGSAGLLAVGGFDGSIALHSVRTPDAAARVMGEDFSLFSPSSSDSDEDNACEEEKQQQQPQQQTPTSSSNARPAIGKRQGSQQQQQQQQRRDVGWGNLDASSFSSPRASLFSPSPFSSSCSSYPSSSLCCALPLRPISKQISHADSVLALAYNPFLQLLISGSADATVRVWDVSNAASGSTSRSSSRPPPFYPASGAVTSPEARQRPPHPTGPSFITSYPHSSSSISPSLSNNSALVLQQVLDEHETEVTAVASHRHLLLSGSEEGLLLLWDLRLPTQRCGAVWATTMDHPVKSCALGDTLASAFLHLPFPASSGLCSCAYCCSGAGQVNGSGSSSYTERAFPRVHTLQRDFYGAAEEMHSKGNAAAIGYPACPAFPVQLWDLRATTGHPSSKFSGGSRYTSSKASGSNSGPYSSNKSRDEEQQRLLRWPTCASLDGLQFVLMGGSMPLPNDNTSSTLGEHAAPAGAARNRAGGPQPRGIDAFTTSRNTLQQKQENAYNSAFSSFVAAASDDMTADSDDAAAAADAQLCGYVALYDIKTRQEMYCWQLQYIKEPSFVAASPSHAEYYSATPCDFSQSFIVAADATGTIETVAVPL